MIYPNTVCHPDGTTTIITLAAHQPTSLGGFNSKRNGTVITSAYASVGGQCKNIQPEEFDKNIQPEEFDKNIQPEEFDKSM